MSEEQGGMRVYQASGEIHSRSIGCLPRGAYICASDINELPMAVKVHIKEITSHGREVARTGSRTHGKSHARTHHHVARTSNLSHGHPDFPWGDFPARPGLNQRRGS